ncbi:hypothetical protein MMC30_005363 [Trapelia coarctata]|nr:hypothetical protein [Trapelia coarctata]
MDERRSLLATGSSHGSKHPAQEESSERPNDKEPETRKLVLIMISVWGGTFCAGLDGTIMATLSAPIATSFQSLPLLAWMATAYLIGSAATQPLSGKLTDIYSRRTGLLVSNLFFAAGNLICGLASKRWMIIAGRALAGMGGGGLNTISTIIISDLVPLRKRGLWQGFGNLCWGLGNGLGGLFGGYLNDVWSWRSAFLSQIPLTAVSALMVYIYVDNVRVVRVKESDKPSIRRVDFLGSFLLVAALVVLLLGLNSGGNLVPWSHPLILSSLPLCAVLLCAFVFVEERIASEPVIPVRLLLDRTVGCACLTNWFFTMIVYALIFYIPIYFRARGLSTTNAGAALIPFSFTTAAGSLIVGIITTRTGKYKYLNMAILFFMLLATVLTCTLTLYTPQSLPLLYIGLAGLAFGGMLTVTLLALISAVEHRDQAVVTSLSYAFRSTGSVIGVAFASTIFQNILRTNLWSRLGDRKNASEIIRRIRDSLDEVNRLPLGDQPLVRRSYMGALAAVFLATVGLAVVGCVSGLLIKELKLHTSLDREDVVPPANTLAD